MRTIRVRIIKARDMRAEKGPYLEMLHVGDLESPPVADVVGRWTTSSEAISLAPQSIGTVGGQGAIRVAILGARPPTFHDHQRRGVGRNSFGIHRGAVLCPQVSDDPIRFAPIALASFQDHPVAVVLPLGYQPE